MLTLKLENKMTPRLHDQNRILIEEDETALIFKTATTQNRNHFDITDEHFIVSDQQDLDQ